MTSLKFNFTREELNKIEQDPFLTRREKRVFNFYYKDGLSYAEIAAELEPQVCIRTVGNILKNIRKKAEEYIL